MTCDDLYAGSRLPSRLKQKREANDFRTSHVGSVRRSSAQACPRRSGCTRTPAGSRPGTSCSSWPASWPSGRYGHIVGPGDFQAQARQAFANVRAVLAGAGMGPEHVAKFTTYLSAAVFRRAVLPGGRKKVFADWYPGGGFPPNTLLVVARLVQPDFMVEIEAVAARAPGA